MILFFVVLAPINLSAKNELSILTVFAQGLVQFSISTREFGKDWRKFACFGTSGQK